MAVEAVPEENVAQYAQESEVGLSGPVKPPQGSFFLQLLGLFFYCAFSVFRIPRLAVLAFRSDALLLRMKSLGNRAAGHAVILALGLIALWAAPFAAEQITGRTQSGEFDYFSSRPIIRVGTFQAIFPDVIDRPTLLETTVILRPRDEILAYDVRGNDTLVDIAARFGVSLDTLLWANDIAPDHLLYLGDKLRIPPMDGVIYVVGRGDVLQEIAENYQSNPVAIAEYNRIGLSTTLAPGMELIIPHGVLPETLRKSSAETQLSQREQPVAAFGEFRWPTNGAITQYFYFPGHPGLDIGNRTGTAIFAADAGQVVAAGWSPIGYGYRIVINHGNGWVTTYSHLSTFAVTVGDFVRAGEVIGKMGNTGYSTGPHLHFEALYQNRFRDPLTLLS